MCCNRIAEVSFHLKSVIFKIVTESFILPPVIVKKKSLVRQVYDYSQLKLGKWRLRKVKYSAQRCTAFKCCCQVWTQDVNTPCPQALLILNYSLESLMPQHSMCCISVAFYTCLWLPYTFIILECNRTQIHVYWINSVSLLGSASRAQTLDYINWWTLRAFGLPYLHLSALDILPVVPGIQAGLWVLFAFWTLFKRSKGWLLISWISCTELWLSSLKMGGHAQCLQTWSSWIAMIVIDNGSEGSVGKLERRGRERQEVHPLAGESALS